MCVMSVWQDDIHTYRCAIVHQKWFGILFVSLHYPHFYLTGSSYAIGTLYKGS